MKLHPHQDLGRYSMGFQISNRPIRFHWIKLISRIWKIQIMRIKLLLGALVKTQIHQIFQKDLKSQNKERYPATLPRTEAWVLFPERLWATSLAKRTSRGTLIKMQMKLIQIVWFQTNSKIKTIIWNNWMKRDTL